MTEQGYQTYLSSRNQFCSGNWESTPGNNRCRGPEQQALEGEGKGSAWKWLEALEFGVEHREWRRFSSFCVAGVGLVGPPTQGAVSTWDR